MFNNPNYFQYPNYQPKQQLFSNIKKINFSELLNGTQKTLNLINQAIPIFYQLKPLWNNTKTIFKIANAINEPNIKKETPSKTNDNNKKERENKTKPKINYNEPTFFL